MIDEKYYISSKQRNSKRFFEQIMPAILRDMGYVEDEIKEEMKKCRAKKNNYQKRNL